MLGINQFVLDSIEPTLLADASVGGFHLQQEKNSLEVKQFTRKF